MHFPSKNENAENAIICPIKRTIFSFCELDFFLCIILILSSSGSHIQRGGKNARVNTVNKILGGYTVHTFADDSDHLIYKETSQGPEALRPWFIIPAKEDEKTLPDLCYMFETELHDAMDNLKIKIGQKEHSVQLEIANLLFDTKLIRYLTGLHGAFCTMCDASEKDGCDLDCIEEGTDLFTFLSAVCFTN